MQTYKFEQVHLCTFAFPSEMYYNCFKLLADIIIGLIATLNAFILLDIARKTPFYDLKMYM